MSLRVDPFVNLCAKNCVKPDSIDMLIQKEGSIIVVGDVIRSINLYNIFNQASNCEFNQRS